MIPINHGMSDLESAARLEALRARGRDPIGEAAEPGCRDWLNGKHPLGESAASLRFIATLMIQCSNPTWHKVYSAVCSYLVGSRLVMKSATRVAAGGSRFANTAT